MNVRYTLKHEGREVAAVNGYQALDAVLRLFGYPWSEPRPHDVGADLAGADLAGANLADAYLAGALVYSPSAKEG